MGGVGTPRAADEWNRAITPRGRTFGRASMCLLSFPANDPPSGFANTQPIADDDESGAEMGRARVEWAMPAARPLFSSDDLYSASAREPANFDQLIISSAGPLTRGTSSDVWRPGGPRGRHTPSGARYPGCSPLRRFPRASAPSRSSARVPRASSPRQRAAGATLLGASSDDLDGADAGPADDGMTGNPLFTPDFKKAFMEAQERIEAREAPDRARIDAEVAEIMARVETERELESQLPEDDEPPRARAVLSLRRQGTSRGGIRRRAEQSALHPGVQGGVHPGPGAHRRARGAHASGPRWTRSWPRSTSMYAPPRRAVSPHRPRRSNPRNPNLLSGPPDPDPAAAADPDPDALVG